MLSTTSWCLFDQWIVVYDAWSPGSMYSPFQSNQISHALSHHLALARAVPSAWRVLVPLFCLENSYSSFNNQLKYHLFREDTLYPASPHCPPPAVPSYLHYCTQRNVYWWLVIHMSVSFISQQFIRYRGHTGITPVHIQVQHSLWHKVINKH